MKTKILAVALSASVMTLSVSCTNSASPKVNHSQVEAVGSSNEGAVHIGVWGTVLMLIGGAGLYLNNLDISDYVAKTGELQKQAQQVKNAANIPNLPENVSGALLRSQASGLNETVTINGKTYTFKYHIQLDYEDSLSIAKGSQRDTLLAAGTLTMVGTGVSVDFNLFVKPLGDVSAHVDNFGQLKGFQYSQESLQKGGKDILEDSAVFVDGIREEDLHETWAAGLAVLKDFNLKLEEEQANWEALTQWGVVTTIGVCLGVAAYASYKSTQSTKFLNK